MLELMVRCNSLPKVRNRVVRDEDIMPHDVKRGLCRLFLEFGLGVVSTEQHKNLEAIT
jgi:hypothetical protein